MKIDINIVNEQKQSKNIVTTDKISVLILYQKLIRKMNNEYKMAEMN